MRVFVSYSFIDSELHLLTLLFEKLRKDGHTVESSDTYFIEDNAFRIVNSELFIGLVTNNSDSITQVVKEWEFARDKGVKTILLIEEGVEVDDPSIKYILFNRSNPNHAIDKLFGVARHKPTKKNDDLTDALVGAGIIVGIAALIALLAGGGKK